MKVSLLTDDELKTICEQAAQRAVELYVHKNSNHKADLRVNNEHEPLLSTDTACKELTVSRATLNNWEKKGIIKGHRIGRRVYFKRSELIQSRGGNS